MDGNGDGETGIGGSQNDGRRQGGINNQPVDPKGLSRVEYVRRVKEQRSQVARQLKASDDVFLPAAREQTKRVRGEDSLAWTGLFTSRPSNEIAAVHLARLAGLKGGMLTDTEAQAVSEHLDSQIRYVHTRLIVCGLITGALAARRPGRDTFRFPFFQPKYAFRGNPVTGNLPIRFAWHAARAGAYWITYGVFASSLVMIPFQGLLVNDLRDDVRMKNVFIHPSQFQYDADPSSANGNGMDQEYSQAQADSYEQYTGSQPQSEREQSRLPNAETNSAWRNLQRTAPDPRASAESLQRQDDWEESTSNADDASPVASAPTPQARRFNNNGGSAWDRVRQQSQSHQDESGAAQAWTKSQPASGWSDDAGTSPEYHGPRESFSYSGADAEKATAKSQAQQEFDQLLDKERQGDDQERGSWNRK